MTNIIKPGINNTNTICSNAGSPNASAPWLSIVIPLYNAASHLPACLNSIAAQRFQSFEVLLVDDGSTDTSPDICQRFSRQDNRFRYIKKVNGGAFQARIYGAERARGAYITFCDADDYYANRSAFNRIHEEITKSGCQVLQFGRKKVFNHLSRKEHMVKSAFDVDRSTFWVQEYPKLLCSFWDSSHLTPTVWNKVYKRSLLAALPDSNSAERIFWAEDLIINLHLMSGCQSVRFIPDVLYCYRQFSGGTSKFSLNVMAQVDRLKAYQLRFLEDYDGSEKPRIQRILFAEVAGWFFYYIQQALHHLDEPQLIALINESLQYPQFILARTYFLENPDADDFGANLLRKGDAQEYVKQAREHLHRRTRQDFLRQTLRRIYAAI